MFVPQQIAFFSGMAVRAVACGDTHTLVVTQDGHLYTFGRNQNGQLGHGNTDDVLSPKLVEALQVRGGGFRAKGKTCFFKRDHCTALWAVQHPSMSPTGFLVGWIE